MSTLFGPDEVEAAVCEVLEHLQDGSRPPSRRLESKHVDLKEEAGRRDTRGNLQSTPATNEAAARQLAGEATCMANTPGGGALVVGVTDDGEVIGTTLDAEWLRGRIYDLTQRLLTVEIRVVEVRGRRLIVVRSPQAVEPIRWNHRITWRVDDRCVEIDAATWHSRRMAYHRHDWSDLDSHVDPTTARPQSLALAREYLRESGESHARELASVPDGEFLRRLNVVTADGSLTNAGVLAFVGRPDPALDYIRRKAPGADSVARVRTGGRSLIEEVADVERTVAAHNDVRQIRRGLVVGRVRELPDVAIREAIVNGVVHRDWASQAPTVVEHVGRSLVVTSPGGFVGGVTPANIITHPSQARNRALAELFSALRLAEREGVGVDRMVREMLSVGYPAPDIREIPGPFVRAALVGDAVDEAWIRFLYRLSPDEARDDLHVLMLLRHLVDHWWVDVASASPLLQVSALEAGGAITGFTRVTIDGRAIVAPVAGVPNTKPEAWHITVEARDALAHEDSEVGAPRRSPSRTQVAMDWALARGRVSSTELASIVGAHSSNVGTVLRALEDAGDLRASRENRRGAGFYFVPNPAIPGAPS